MRKSPSRSTSTSIKRRPLSAEAAFGSPRPVLALTRCQGRVMLIQPRLIASKREGLRRSVVGQFRMHQVREEGQPQAGLHLVGVLAGVIEQPRIDVARHAEPVADAQKHSAAMVQLAGQRLQLVAAVAVEQHELAHPLSLQRIDQIGQQAQQGRRRDTARQGAGDPQVIGVDAVGNGRQQGHPAPAW